MFGGPRERRLPACSRTPPRGVTCNSRETSQRGPVAGAPGTARRRSSDGSSSSSWPLWSARTSAPRPSPRKSPAWASRVAPPRSPRTPIPTASARSVLIQSKSLKTDDPEYRAVVADVTERLEDTKGVTEIDGPYGKGEQRTAISDDGHSTLVSFEIKGDTEDAAAEEGRRRTRSPRSRPPRRRTPTSTSSSSARAAPRRPSWRSSRAT